MEKCASIEGSFAAFEISFSMHHAFPFFVPVQKHAPFSAESFRFVLINVLWAFQKKAITFVTSF